MFRTVSQSNIDDLLESDNRINMIEKDTVMEYVNRLFILETRLENNSHMLRDNEKRRAVLKRLRGDFEVTGDVIRGMDKSVNEAIVFLVMKEGKMKLVNISKAVTSSYKCWEQKSSREPKSLLISLPINTNPRTLCFRSSHYISPTAGYPRSSDKGI